MTDDEDIKRWSALAWPTPARGTPRLASALREPESTTPVVGVVPMDLAALEA
jgi:hypothetical protein